MSPLQSGKFLDPPKKKKPKKKNPEVPGGEGDPTFIDNNPAEVIGALGSIKIGDYTLNFSFTGNPTLTVPKTGTVALGTGSANTIPYWVDVNTLGASNLKMQGANVLTLEADGAYTGTVPRTGIIATAPKITFFDDGSIRCLAVKLTNKTGGASVVGKIVKAGSATNSFVLTGADDDMPIGVMIEAGVADGSETWVAVSGVAYVQYDDNVGSTLGNIVYCSTAGRVNSSATVPADVVHFREVGHCLQTVAATGAGTYVNSLTLLHFN